VTPLPECYCCAEVYTCQIIFEWKLSDDIVKTKQSPSAETRMVQFDKSHKWSCKEKIVDSVIDGKENETSLAAHSRIVTLARPPCDHNTDKTKTDTQKRNSSARHH